MISLIAAIGKNNELGKGNTLLWIFPNDQKHFREITSGHKVIMGRKTFESIGRPLPKRRNVVITRDKKYTRAGVEVAHSLEEVLKLVKVGPSQEVFIIGGAEIYKQSMKFVDRLYITHVNAEDKKADVFFPEIIPIVWNKISHEEHKKDDKNPFSYTFSTYERL